ncbi:MAG: hypothetical protein RI885_498 [Actinomycetota bacterium]
MQDRATGWVKYGLRWYNPVVGRWAQQDTLDAPLDPANANRYAFAGNDPINNTDPTGLVTCEQFTNFSGTVGGVLGGIALGAAAFGGPVGVAVAGITGAAGFAIGAPALLIGGLELVGLAECN